MTKRCPKETKHVQKWSQMAAKRCPKRPKWRPKWTKNGVKLESSPPKPNQRTQVSIFLRFSVHLGSHLGTIFVPSAMKNTSKKATENQGRTNIENHAQRSQKLCQKASQIGYKNYVKSEFVISMFFQRVPRTNWLVHGSRAPILDGNSIKIQAFPMAEVLKRKWRTNV